MQIIGGLHLWNSRSRGGTCLSDGETGGVWRAALCVCVGGRHPSTLYNTGESLFRDLFFDYCVSLGRALL